MSNLHIKVIEGFPLYIITNEGNIYNRKTKRQLKHIKNPAGYPIVNLYDGEKINYNPVHRLVAKHFIPNPNNYSDVDHIDCDPSNCHFINLRWCSHMDNCQNRKISIRNKSGHKNIGFSKSHNKYMYSKRYMGKTKQKFFKTLTDTLCYKYIHILKIKAKII